MNRATIHDPTREALKRGRRTAQHPSSAALPSSVHGEKTSPA